MARVANGEYSDRFGGGEAAKKKKSKRNIGGVERSPSEREAALRSETDDDDDGDWKGRHGPRFFPVDNGLSGSGLLPLEDRIYAVAAGVLPSICGVKKKENRGNS